MHHLSHKLSARLLNLHKPEPQAMSKVLQPPTEADIRGCWQQRQTFTQITEDLQLTGHE